MTLAFPATVYADDYFTGHYKNRLQHGIYLKIPLQHGSFSDKTAAFKVGYSADFRRSFEFGQLLDAPRHNFRVPMINIEYSPTSRSRLNLAGLGIAEFDKTGLYLGQDMDGASADSSTTTYILAGALFVGLAAILATSGEDEEDECIPSTINGQPIVIAGQTVCLSDELAAAQ